MDVGAWCGHCGQPFRLVELVESGAPGSCPRCGEALAPGYGVVVATAGRQVLAAADALAAAGRQLAEVAPRLHLDTATLAANLRAVIDH